VLVLGLGSVSVDVVTGETIWETHGGVTNPGRQKNCRFYHRNLNGWTLVSSPYKPSTSDTGCTEQCTNHAPAMAASALIYSMHRVLVVWIIVAHF